MNIFLNILASVVASAVIFFGGMNLPASTFSLSKSLNLGNVGYTSITTATNLADFPTIYNANSTAFDNGKIDISTTSLPRVTTIGTITTGIWNSTPIDVLYGGTGTTSPSRYQVVLGNGSLGLTVASSTGTTGQFLTSNGAGAYPSWQTASVNQTTDYNFTGTYFGIKNLYASSTVANPLVLNGVSVNTPSTQGTASSTLMNDGSGNLKWAPATGLFFANSAPASVSSAASTTVFSTTIPANTMVGNATIHFKVFLSSIHLAAGKKITIGAGYGTATSTVIMTGGASAADPTAGVLDIYVTSTGTNTQRVSQYLASSGGTSGATGDAVSAGNTITGAVNAAAEQPFLVVASTTPDGIFTPVIVTGEYIR